jgi:hypothetical protein
MLRIQLTCAFDKKNDFTTQGVPDMNCFRRGFEFYPAGMISKSFGQGVFFGIAHVSTKIEYWKLIEAELVLISAIGILLN